jgi:hypothetical protein
MGISLGKIYVRDKKKMTLVPVRTLLNGRTTFSPGS